MALIFFAAYVGWLQVYCLDVLVSECLSLRTRRRIEGTGFIWLSTLRGFTEGFTFVFQEFPNKHWDDIFLWGICKESNVLKIPPRVWIGLLFLRSTHLNVEDYR